MSDLVLNSPDLWLRAFPRPGLDHHKYHRGHAVIFAAPELTGATRLAAEACSRIGAGLVSVLAAEREDVYRMTLPPDIMVRGAGLADPRNPNVALIGPGGFHSSALKDLQSDHSLQSIVIDADAIAQARAIKDCAPHLVLTPHEGELARNFPELSGRREERARDVALKLGAVVVLKGRHTLIASPDGPLVENQHASPYLAKAGTGDVLAGLITGILAQGMDPFLACAAAVWIHGDAALRIGPGLVASDLAGQIPSVLEDLL